MPFLIELIAQAPDITDFPQNAASLSITGITMDSRKVTPGTLFVALRGTKTDGTAFIGQAAQAGAAAVLCDMETKVTEKIPVIRASNIRRALAHVAAAYYGKQPEHVVAVTGTDGKTSTCDFYRQFWHHMGKSSASIGTLGVLDGKGDLLFAETQTTPGPVELQRLMADMAERGITHLGMEASSHGLHQHRLDGVKLQAGAFTNLARDHLDYHRTEEEYFKAKLRLFEALLPEGATAVLNQDDRHFPTLREICHRRKLRVVGFGLNGGEYRIVHVEPTAHGQNVRVELYGKKHMLEVPLVGRFQVMNILAALGLARATGGELEQALSAIPKFKGVPGRLEHVATLTGGMAVFIDYAHTPMALANILNTLRPHTKKHLHVVFGCGGDRDTGKRPEMGRIADTLADYAIVTDDNPRSEDPGSIRKAVLAACPRGKEVADRKEAIYVALQALKPGDTLVVAGKGHEKTQIVGDKIFPFDDAEIIRNAVKALRLAA